MTTTDAKPRMPQKARPLTAARAAQTRWAKTPVSDDFFERMAAAAPRLTADQRERLRSVLARPAAEGGA